MEQSSSSKKLSISILSISARNIYSAVPKDFPFYKLLQILALKKKAKIRAFDEAIKKGILIKVGEGEEADYYLNENIIVAKTEIGIKELDKVGLPYKAYIIRTKNKKTFFVIYYVEDNEEYFMAIIEKK